MDKRKTKVANQFSSVDDTEDVALFRQVVADVKPLRAPNKVQHRRIPQKPIPRQHLLDEQNALAESLNDHISWENALESGEELAYFRDGLSRQTLRKLRRGDWIIQDQLDLHGLTIDEARVLTANFLSACIKRGLRCVRIVHGKGLRSKNREPVLKKKVAGWLMQRNEVLAFCQAKPADGGSGAALVLLKSANR